MKEVIIVVLLLLLAIVIALVLLKSRRAQPIFGQGPTRIFISDKFWPKSETDKTQVCGVIRPVKKNAEFTSFIEKCKVGDEIIAVRYRSTPDTADSANYKFRTTITEVMSFNTLDEFVKHDKGATLQKVYPGITKLDDAKAALEEALKEKGGDYSKYIVLIFEPVSKVGFLNSSSGVTTAPPAKKSNLYPKATTRKSVVKKNARRIGRGEDDEGASDDEVDDYDGF